MSHLRYSGIYGSLFKHENDELSVKKVKENIRVKSGKLRHQVNSDTRLQTEEIQMKRLLMSRLFMSRLIRIFTVCLVN